MRLEPEHPSGHFFLAIIEWWRIITDINNTSHDEKFLSMLDQVIEICDQRLDQNEDDITALFYKGGALGFQGRLYGNRDDWIQAVNCGRTALPIVQRAYKLQPNNYDILLGIGIYNYYAAVIPEEYPIVKPLTIFFPKGNKDKGIEQLRLASERARYANVEATYFLMQIFQHYEKKYDETLRLAQKLHILFPKNVVFHKYVGRAQTGLHRWIDMERTWLEILRRVKENYTGYGMNAEREANYYLGLKEMQFEKYDSALLYLYRADELSRILDANESSGFIATTNLKIGMIYDLQGKRNLAVSQYNKVLKMNDYQNVHQQAKRYLKFPYKKS